MAMGSVEAKAHKKAAKKAAKEAAAAAEAAAAEAEAVATTEVDDEEAKKQRKQAKKAAKMAAAEQAVAPAEEVDEAEAKRQRKAAKRAAKEALAAEAAEAEAEVVDEAEAKRQRKAAKKAAAAAAAAAAEEAAAPEEEVDEAEAKRRRKAAKKAAKEAAAEESAKRAADEDEEEDAPKKKKSKTAAEPEEGGNAKTEETKQDGDRNNDHTAFIRGLPFSVSEEVLRKDFSECGEIERLNMPMNEEGRPRGIAFVKFVNQEGFDAALKFDNTDYGGRTIFVSKAGEGGKGKGKDGKGKDGKGKDGGNELTVFVRGLPFSVEEEVLKKDFAECGEIESLRLPMNEEGRPRGIAFIKFKTQEGMDAALKFDDTEYGGRTINCSKAGEGGKGKGKDGKDGGKGKGKDGKGKKGKGKKGKKDGPSSEKRAAQSGAMVESTGEKKTFDDSDDEE